MGRLSRALAAVCVVAIVCAPARTARVAPSARAAAVGESQLPTFKPSNILDALRRRKASGPALPAAGLARHGSALLARRGFDYDFDVCELVPTENLPRRRGPRPDGTWTQITPEHRMTRADDTTHTLKRPASFALDEAYLVADDPKTVLRTWQLPYQTVPSGVSPDARSLYLSFYEDGGLDELVPEVTEGGRPRFRAAREAASR